MERTIFDYIRFATLHRVIDGDTVELMVDLGFRRYSREKVRLMGVNAPEPKGDTRLKGMAATEFVWGWFAEADLADDRILLVSHSADSFGRWLGSIYRVNSEGNLGQGLADALLEAGQATVYQAP